MAKKQAEFERRLDEETQARIARMEEPSYPFPQRFSRQDYLLWGLVSALCLAMLIVGAWL